MNIGDIVYIQGAVRVYVGGNSNWNFRDMSGAFDYFGQDTPYIFITNEQQLEDSIGTDLWDAYESAMERYNKDDE